VFVVTNDVDGIMLILSLPLSLSISLFVRVGIAKKLLSAGGVKNKNNFLIINFAQIHGEPGLT